METKRKKARPAFAASLMCMDFLRMREQMEALNETVDFLHVDIMDGHFCKNITLSPDLVRTFASVAERPLDVHLMTIVPNDWIERVAEAGAGYISVHAETINTDAFRTLRGIEALGCKTGVVLNPATPLAWAEHYIGMVDMLTLMTVDVGYAGQPFIEQMLPKIAEARELKEKHGYHYSIQVDGSCNETTFKRLVEAGAEVLVLGTSGLFAYDVDVRIAYRKMLETYDKTMQASCV